MKERVMEKHEKWETVAASELLLVSGGIWDYSNRLGPVLGQMLEDKNDAFHPGLLDTPTNLDAAAAQAGQGWVSLK